jgi:hypothetical protein
MQVLDRENVEEIYSSMEWWKEGIINAIPGLDEVMSVVGASMWQLSPKWSRNN